ncbi:MAG: hypothetical protein K2O54_04765, partial [Prevotella sp.]|nr:hypothetical protein [Prevotella sp.]
VRRGEVALSPPLEETAKLLEDLYLKDIWYKNVDDSFWTRDPKVHYSSETLSTKSIAAYKRIMKRTGNDDATWKIKSVDRTTYFVLETYRMEDGDRYACGNITVLDFITEDAYSGIMMLKYDIDPNADEILEDEGASMFFNAKISTSSLTVDEKSYKYHQQYDADRFVCQALQYLRDGDFDDNLRVRITNHNDSEMDVFKTVLNLSYTAKKESWMSKCLFAMIPSKNRDIEEYATLSRMIDDVLNDDSPSTIVSSWDEPNPIISLGANDWNFIFKWISDNKLMDDNPINLLELYDKQPYGRRMYDSLKINGEPDLKILEELRVSHTHNCASISILAKLEEFGYARLVFNLDNADECNLSQDLV